jgi:helicase domain protein
MFNDLDIEQYYTTNDDVVNLFFVPLLNEAIQYDRTTAYFSMDSLATYARGLEQLVLNNGHCRLIISHQISEYDFESIQQGYSLREEITLELLDELKKETIKSLHEGISNLAYMIAIGAIDIKIAFMQEGLFHDKVGLLKDKADNWVSFAGSNNETIAGIHKNHESFTVNCSWWSDENSPFAKGIQKVRNTFELLWNNKQPRVIVKDIPDVIRMELLKHNKGFMIMNQDITDENVILMDLEDNCITIKIRDKQKFALLKRSPVYNIELKPLYIDKNLTDDSHIVIKKDRTYRDIGKIATLLHTFARDKGMLVKQSKALLEFLEQRSMQIEERSRVGIDLKARDPRLFEAYNIFKSKVDANMARPLRESQMWDAFYMYSMKKCANFSVPGSGKTSTVLGVYAYLCEIGEADKLIVVGPKNSFGSWKDEFVACFGNKLPLNCFDSHDSLLSSRAEKKRLLNYEYNRFNLFLFNYEGVDSYKSAIEEILVSGKCLLVYDEVHRVKRVNGERAKVAREIAYSSKRTVVMTGTPIPNGYRDIYTMLHILYEDDYNDFFRYKTHELEKLTNESADDLNSRLLPFYCRTSKKDLGVPEANPDEIISLDVTDREQRLFELLSSAYRKNKFALIIRLLQLESNPRMLLEKIDSTDFEYIFDDTQELIEDMDFIDCSQEITVLVNDSPLLSTKQRKCINLVQSIVEQEKTVICWCIFKQSMYDLQQALSGLNISSEIINGSIAQGERQQILSDFKNKKFSVLITNPHTLAESVSLHNVCHDAIYFEYSYNLVHLLQSKDRIHRLGLPTGQYTQYYYLMDYFKVNGQEYSLDRKIYDRLMDKELLMLNAIDHQVLESGASDEEDLQLILGDLY